MVASFRKYSSGLKIGATATTTTLNSDYPAGEPGRIIWVTGSGAFYRDNGIDWEPLADGTITLTGQPLNQNEIIVGNSLNKSAAVNTSSVGDILGTDSTGLTIKSGVISDGQISASAAVALTKLATLTASRALVSNASGFISASSTTSTEIGFVSGVTSSIQSQLNAKLTSATGFINGGNSFGSAATLGTNDNFALNFETNGTIRATLTAAGILQLANLTANTAIISDGSKGLISSSVTATELGYVSGVTSSIQTQFAGKLSLTGGTMTGAILGNPGSVGGPGYAFSGDATTGFYTVNPGEISIASAGTNTFGFLAAQFRSFINGTVTVPAFGVGSANSGLYNASGAVGITDTGTSIALFQNSVGTKPQILVGVANTDVNLPQYTFQGDPNTGLWWSASDSLSLVTGGVAALSVSSTGLVSLANLTANRAVVSDASKNLISSATTDVEIGYLSGVTSSVQTQLTGKVAKAGDTMTGALILSGDPITALQAATKQYVDNVAQGLKPKAAARLASTGNLTLSGTQTIDGVAAIAGDRVLVKNQSTAADNGIYVVAAGAWSRATDMDSLSPIDEINGAFLAIQEGTANAGKLFVETGTVTTLGTSPINFVFFNSTATLVGGNGITVSGNNISVNQDGQGLTFVATQLSIQLDGTTLAKSGTGLKVATGGITNNEVNAAAGITYSKLSLTGSIVNADVATGAAIALTKLATVTANRALISDGSGFISPSTVTSTELGYVSGVTSSIQTQFGTKVTGPASATDTAIARYNGTTGKLIQDSTATLDGSGNIVTPGLVTAGSLTVTGTVIGNLALAANLSVTGSVGSNLVPLTDATYTLGASGKQWLEVWATSIKSATSITTYSPVIARGTTAGAVVEEAYVDATTLAASTTAVIATFTLATANYRGYELDYVITQATTSRVRTGHLSVVTNGTDVSITDTFNETGDAGITWTAAINGANVELTYTNASANASTLRADSKRFRA